VANELGLSPSLGKVYVSEQFCVINSQAFRRDGKDVSLVPYPNASGLQRYDARTYSKEKTPSDLSSSYKLWMSGFTDYSQQVLAEDLWYREFSFLLKSKDIEGIEYYLDPSLGGLGLPLPICVKRRSEVMNREIGRRAFARMRCCVATGIPRNRLQLEMEPSNLRDFNVAPDKIFNPFNPENKQSKVLILSAECDRTIIPMQEYWEDEESFSALVGNGEEYGLTDNERIVSLLKLKGTLVEEPNKEYYAYGWERDVANSECSVKTGCSLTALSCLNSRYTVSEIGKVQKTKVSYKMPSRFNMYGFEKVNLIPYKVWSECKVHFNKSSINVWKPKLLCYHETLFDLEESFYQLQYVPTTAIG